MTTSQAPLPGTAAAGKGLNLLGLIRQNKAKLPVTNQQSRPEPTPPVEGLVKPELPIPTTPTPTHPTPPARPHITSILKRPRSSHTNDNFTRWTCQHSRRISILLRRDNQAEEHAAPVAGPSQVKKVEVEKEGDALKSAGLALRERLKKGWVNPTLPSAAAPEKGKGKEKEGEQEAEYEVECILASEKRRSSPSDPKKQRWYLVKWAGYPEEEATWEPRENVRETVALDEWIRGKKEKRERDEEEEQKPVKRRRVK
ncbi:hypothetical protein JCM8097_005339 [Rhodosporidiobolus ruineniae]